VIPWWGLAIAVLGINFALWGLAGLCRLAATVFPRWSGGRRPARRATAVAAARPQVADVAVLIPAHNEAVVIADTLTAIMALVPRANVHVVSDGSTDDTVRIAQDAGATVIATRENVGKAGALAEAIERLGLIGRFGVIMLLDADTRVEPGYFEAGLAMFDDPKVVAVAGCVRTARGRTLSFAGNLLVSHRQRIYAIGQRVLKFGQTWARTNATPIVPGFASMYRSEVLPRIDMNPPGLVIEDFNMTFEVYQKRLGKVGFTLGAVAVTQDPDNFGDYVRQTRRWAVGLWQTVRRHPPRANLFTAMLAVLLLELVTSSLLFLVLPLLFLVLLIPEVAGGAPGWPMFAQAYAVVTVHVRLSSVLIGILLPDFALTCAAAAAERQPRLLLFAPFYPVMRLVDAAIGLSAIPVAWLTRASGRWRSPARREIHAGPGAVLPAAAVPAAAVPAAVPQAAVLRAAVPAAAAPQPAGPHANAGDGSHAARR
jgi:cellulose synthase/poly-beta-1,6-N-acetylglucosamine synthase-like glycosyltransferase